MTVLILPVFYVIQKWNEETFLLQYLSLSTSDIQVFFIYENSWCYGQQK